MRVASSRIASILMIGMLLLFPLDLRGQQDSTRIVVVGVVGDAGAGTPLQGAVASIPELKLRTLTDDRGRFLLKDVPPGTYLWRFQMLGYADWEEEMEVRGGDFLRVGLLPRPIVLENITVAVDRLARRRKAVPYSVVVLTNEQIDRTAAGSAFELIWSRSPVSLRECPLPLSNEVSGGGTADLFSSVCVYYRGRNVRPAVYVDEEITPTTLDMLSAYAAHEIHSVEYYQNATHIRVYTKYFIGSGKAILPIGLAFRRY